MAPIRFVGGCVASLVLLCGAAMGQALQFADDGAGSGLAGDSFSLPINAFEPMICGGTIGDFNNDGAPDVFLLGGGTYDDQLYINNGNATFTDEALTWGVQNAHLGSGAIAGDFNADGWLDIYITSHGPTNAPAPGAHRLYRNNGDASFTDVATTAGVNATDPTGTDGFGAAFGDFDLDGDLDLAVAGWATSVDGNRLFQNNADGTFTDVTTTAILFDMFPVRGFSPRFVDMNDDRYPELLWVSDFVTSKYLINNTNGTFTESTGPSGTGLDQNGMGTTIADFNGDSILDWYVTSIFVAGDPNEEGNRLYLGQGNHTFVQDAIGAGVDEGGWGWGTDAQDFDHDGSVDIAATNGWPYAGGLFLNDPTRLFINDGTGSFTDEAPTCNLTHTGQGRGLATMDYDIDGDMDIVIFNYRDSLDLFRNDLAGPNAQWLKVYLDSSAYPGIAPNGVGAKIEITIAGVSQVRMMQANSNYLCGSEMVAHFGLGAATSVDLLRVTWPDGRVSTRWGVAADQATTLTPACDGDADDNNTVDINDIAYVIFRLGGSGAPGTVDGDADGNGVVDVNDVAYVIFRLGTGC